MCKTKQNNKKTSTFPSYMQMSLTTFKDRKRMKLGGELNEGHESSTLAPSLWFSICTMWAWMLCEAWPFFRVAGCQFLRAPSSILKSPGYLIWSFLYIDKRVLSDKLVGYIHVIRKPLSIPGFTSSLFPWGHLAFLKWSSVSVSKVPWKILTHRLL